MASAPATGNDEIPGVPASALVAVFAFVFYQHFLAGPESAFDMSSFIAKARAEKRRKAILEYCKVRDPKDDIIGAFLPFTPEDSEQYRTIKQMKCQNVGDRRTVRPATLRGTDYVLGGTDYPNVARNLMYGSSLVILLRFLKFGHAVDQGIVQFVRNVYLIVDPDMPNRGKFEIGFATAFAIAVFTSFAIFFFVILPYSSNPAVDIYRSEVVVLLPVINVPVPLFATMFVSILVAIRYFTKTNRADYQGNKYTTALWLITTEGLPIFLLVMAFYAVVSGSLKELQWSVIGDSVMTALSFDMLIMISLSAAMYATLTFTSSVNNPNRLTDTLENVVVLMAFGVWLFTGYIFMVTLSEFRVSPESDYHYLLGSGYSASGVDVFSFLFDLLVVLASISLSDYVMNDAYFNPNANAPGVRIARTGFITGAVIMIIGYGYMTWTEAAIDRALKNLEVYSLDAQYRLQRQVQAGFFLGSLGIFVIFYSLKVAAKDMTYYEQLVMTGLALFLFLILFPLALDPSLFA